MASLWPWLAIAGAGALHGLNPLNGWVFAAASGVRSRTGAKALRTLLPIAAGHAASVGLVAAALTLGLALDRVVLQGLALTLLGAAAILHFAAGTASTVRAPAGHVGLALWSFVMSTAHGAGLMMVPALMPLCTGAAASGAITASGSLLLALAAVAVHTAAMLAVGAAIAVGACRGVALGASARRVLASLHVGPRPATARTASARKGA